MRTFGYYAHGVDETTAILPEGWRDRLVLVENENTQYVRGWCLEAHDLAIAKYAAGREKDLEFTAALARYSMVARDVLEQRLAATPLAPVHGTAFWRASKRTIRANPAAAPAATEARTAPAPPPRRQTNRPATAQTHPATKRSPACGTGTYSLPA